MEMSRIEMVGIAAIIVTLLIQGCMEEKVNYVYGTLGPVEVRGDIDKVAILNYSVESFIYKNDTMQRLEGFVYQKKTHRYEVKGIAKNIASKNLSKVKICVTFYREESKMLKPLITKCYIGSRKIAKNETFEFKIKYLHGDEGFGEIDKIDFWITAK